MKLNDCKQRYSDQAQSERTSSSKLTFFSTTATSGLMATDTRFFKIPVPFFDFFEFLRCSMLNSKVFVEQCAIR